jgi:hypothetical protein
MAMFSSFKFPLYKFPCCEIAEVDVREGAIDGTFGGVVVWRW